MPTLPAASDFTGSAITEAQFKTAITSQREFLATLLGTAGTQAAALSAMGVLLHNVASKTAAYTVVAGDRGKLLDCTGTWTLGLTAAATLGAGFAFAVRNSGAGTITIDPNSTELIDGETSIAIGPGDSCMVMCTGAAFVTVGRSTTEIPDQSGNAGKFLYTDGSNASWDHLPVEYKLIVPETNVGAVSVLDLTWDESLYDGIRIELSNVIPSATVALQARMGYGNGATFATSGYEFLRNGVLATGASLMTLSESCGTAAGETTSAVIDLTLNGNGGFAGTFQVASKNSTFNSGSAGQFWFNGTPQAWDAIRLYWFSGSFEAAGTYKLYGRLK